MLLHSIKEVYDSLEAMGDYYSINAMVEALANDMPLLTRLQKMLDKHLINGSNSSACNSSFGK